MSRTRAFTVVIAGVTFLAAGCGEESATASNNGGAGAIRTVEIDMVDIAFEPDTMRVDRGETVQFVFTNRGNVAHDAFIGDAHAQADHEAEMRESEDGEGHGGGHGDDGDDANAVTVEPGDTQELTYTFDAPGTVEVGCHQPGHYDAGMKMTVEVA